MPGVTARQWRDAAMGLRDHAAKFERLAAAAEADEAPVIEVTLDAEDLIRGEGKTLRISTDERGGLQLDMIGETGA